MTDRLTEAFDALFRQMEDPPTWDQVRSQRLSPTRGPSPKPGWLVFAAGFALVLVVGVAAGLLTNVAIAPTQVPLMADATEISPGGIPTQDLGDVIDPQPGDQLYTVPVGRFAIFVRLRAGTRPHMYATSCDVLAEAELPQGWEGTCLERTVNGKREHGVFPYGTTSE